MYSSCTVPVKWLTGPGHFQCLCTRTGSGLCVQGITDHKNVRGARVEHFGSPVTFLMLFALSLTQVVITFKWSPFLENKFIKHGDLYPARKWDLDTKCMLFRILSAHDLRTFILLPLSI